MNDNYTKTKTKTKIKPVDLRQTTNIGDFVVAISKAKESRERFYLLRVTKIDADSLYGFVETDNPAGPQRETVDVAASNVLLNLGPKPRPGKVYGVDTGHIWLKTFQHEFWGSVHVFTRMDAETLNLVRKGLDSTAHILKKLKLERYVDHIHTELREAKGKWAGMYNHAKEGPSRIWYAPEKAMGSLDAMKNVILHEYGHVLRYNGLTNNDMRASWLKLYNRSVAKNIVDKTTLRRYFQDLSIEYNNDPEIRLAEALKSIAQEDEDQKNLRAVLKWFKDIHRLGPKDLEILLSAGQLDHLEKLWPSDSLDVSKLDPLVSEYALKSVEELFAESFALYATGIKLPERVTKLLERSLSIIRNNG